MSIEHLLNYINAARVPGVALREAFGREEAAFGEAVLEECLAGVF